MSDDGKHWLERLAAKNGICIINQIVGIKAAELILPPYQIVVYTFQITGKQRMHKLWFSALRNIAMHFVPVLDTAEINTPVDAIGLFGRNERLGVRQDAN